MVGEIVGAMGRAITERSRRKTASHFVPLGSLDSAPYLLTRLDPSVDLLVQDF